MQNTQTPAKHTRDTVEILVSLKLMQTGKPDEAEVANDQAYTITIDNRLIKCWLEFGEIEFIFEVTGASSTH